MANILVKTSISTEEAVKNIHQLIKERPKIITVDTKLQFLQRGVELNLFTINGEASKIRIKSIINILNEYLVHDNRIITYSTKKVYARVGSKVEHPTQYTFTIKKL